MTSTQWDVRAVFPLSLGAFVVWLACGLTMAFGREALGLETALKLHAIAAPVFAALASPLFHAVPASYSARGRCLLHRVHHRP